MLNNLHQKNLRNHSIIRCFGVNVHQKFQFFLSHKVSFTFLNNKTMNDGSHDIKTSVDSFYVPRWALNDQDIDLLACKDVQHAAHTIFATNSRFAKHIDTIISDNCGYIICVTEQVYGKIYNVL